MGMVIVIPSLSSGTFRVTPGGFPRPVDENLTGVLRSSYVLGSSLCLLVSLCSPSGSLTLEAMI